MAEFTYNCAPFSGDSEELLNGDTCETYFDNHENAITNVHFLDPNESDNFKNLQFYSPEVDQFYSPAIFKTDFKHSTRKHGFRKSLSSANLFDIQKLDKDVDDLTNQLNDMQPGKRKNTSNCNLVNNRLYGSNDAFPTKYVSMTEAMHNFHHKTPTRFHTKSKNDNSVILKGNGPIPCTIPQSPMLKTKTRNRPTIVLTFEERELQEFEAEQKFKVRANPINQKVLQGPLKAAVPINKKPATQPAPFNLTQVTKKIPSSAKTKKADFHAKPVPKSLSAPMKPTIENKQKTIPITPNVLKRTQFIRQESKENINPTKQKTSNNAGKLKKTVLQPFSFDKHVTALLERKNELQKQIYEEKHHSIFRAKPMPASLLNSPKIKPKMCGSRLGSKESIKSTHSEGGSSTSSNSLGVSFKARPAAVLQKAPFVPKKVERPPIEINEFALSTVWRAEDRAHYEMIKQQRQEELEEMKRIKEEQIKKLEEEEIALKRKETTHVANPIRTYKAIPVVIPQPVTTPQTPAFLKNKIVKK